MVRSRSLLWAVAATLYPGVRAVPGFQVLDRAVPGWGVGGHDLVGVCLRWCRTGSVCAPGAAFTAHDEPGAGRVAVGWRQAGDLADLRPVAQVAVRVDGRDPVPGRTVDGIDAWKRSRRPGRH
jgi:hypothetical protein